MDAIQKLQRAIVKIARPQGRRGLPGYLGDANGVVETGTPGFVNVHMLTGEVIQVYNQRVPNNPDLLVMVGSDELMPGLIQILSTWPVFGEPAQIDLPSHHETHEYPEQDTVWFTKDQFLPLLVLPNGGFVAYIFGGMLYGAGAWVKVANQTLDLSSYQPATGAEWVLIQSNNSGALSVVEGSVVASKGMLTVDNLPTPDADNTPLCAIQLYDGQTALQRDPRAGKINDFLDLRLTGYASTAPGGDFDLAAEIHAATGKSTPVDADETALADSAASFALKKLTWANVKATLKTYFDTLYQAVGSYVSTSLTISTTAPLSGGGNLSADRTLILDIDSATAKTTPVDADEAVIADSAASNVAKKVTWANIKATLKTYFDTLYQAVGSYVSTTRTINTTAPLSGGGNLSADRTLILDIDAATAKTTPVDADEAVIADSAASNVAKKVTWANIKATLKTYFDGLYATISHAHAASDITSGTLDGDRLPALSTTKKGGAPATGTPSGKFLKDDNTWALPTVSDVGPALKYYMAQTFF